MPKTCHLLTADAIFIGLTWIIIILIVLSILVTCSEVFLRFGLLSAGRSNAQARVQAHLSRLLSVGDKNSILSHKGMEL